MEKCGYKCSKCKAVDRMDKSITIFRFPKILVIHLKRFSRREKITSSISIPQKLDMTPYAPHSSKFPFLDYHSSFLDHGSKKNARSYSFYGMSKHSGSLNGGHYVAEVKNTDSKTWYDCNDSHVS
jgi:ubiquitin C-terminal hydrolase